MSLLIVGGNGFVGSAAAKYAVRQGIKVYSLSRRGPPSVMEDWNEKVEYVQGDAMDKTTYANLVKECTGVIHTVGVLFDSKFKFKNEYKGSYEQMNRDSAIEVAETLRGTKKHFVYLSSERGIFFSPRYISTKRDVEYWLQNNSKDIVSSVLCPGYQYTASHRGTQILGGILNILNTKDWLFDKVGWQTGKDLFSPARSISVDAVGKAAVLCAMRDEFKGRTLDVNAIEEISINY